MSDVSNVLSDPANAGLWALVPEQSSFTFKNKTMWGLFDVKGKFTEFNAEGQIGGDGTVSGRVVIKAASVATGIKQRDKHLRSADFFDAEHYPDITITVNGVGSVADDEVNLRADLSIRGKTVALPMRVRPTVSDDGAVQLVTTTTVQRDQLGVSGNMIGMVGGTTTLSACAVFRSVNP